MVNKRCVVTRYEKTLTEANAQCYQHFEETLKNMNEKQLQEWWQQLDQDEEAIEGFCNENG